jgi:hypothetical protein
LVVRGPKIPITAITIAIAAATKANPPVRCVAASAEASRRRDGDSHRSGCGEG